MSTTDYESLWKSSFISVTDGFSLPPLVLQADDAIIGMLGNFSVSTGKAKAKLFYALYKRYFKKEETMLRIEKDEKHKHYLSINGLQSIHRKLADSDTLLFGAYLD